MTFLSSRFFRALALTAAAGLCASASGCMLWLRSPVSRGIRVAEDRVEVARLNLSALSKDQRHTFDQNGTPKFIVYETELKSEKPVQRWLYPDAKLQFVFVAGKQVDYTVVESSGINPLLEAARNADEGPLQLAWQWLQLLGHVLND